ncbi:BTAD domain-containing putative transcriptional regulator [Streptomyces sp. NPDC051940]|uniref:AfsR/SARP family transcriptional regulator n=1 Tax=Streptomyces sp. NPDC051940 TaxID=3155675 RepID=UPI0034330ED4
MDAERGEQTGSELREQIRFRLLGPVEVQAGGLRVHLAGRQGALLAILLLNAGRVVSVDRLADLMWGEPPPRSPSARIRMLVSELRRSCAVAGEELIRTRRPGYLARLVPGQLDVTAFADGLALARSAAQDGDDAAALHRYDQALGLWRGTPLDGITGSFVPAETARLEELRAVAVEERAETLLHTGRYAEAVAELERVTADHPLRESAHGRLMLALHRGGRRAEALEVYRRLRTRIADELGLEPDRATRGIHQRILGDDTPPATQAARPALPVPRQLPPPPPVFVGRAAEHAGLDRAARAAGAMPVAVLSGAGGSGKTWLALRWAHERLDRYPDGQLHLNLRGFDPANDPLPAHAALRHFLLSLGVHPAAVPAEEEARAGLYRTLLAGRRMLVVLDNARDTAQIEPLLPGSPGCTVLVTSRNRLAGLHATHGAALIGLDVLPPAEARGLLTRQLGAERAAADPDSVARLAEYSGGLPLAVAVLAARAALHPGFPLSVLAEELRSPATRLDALRTGDLSTDLRAAFTSSYQALDDAGSRLFALLGAVPWPGVTVRQAAALAGLPETGTRALLQGLEGAHLVQQHRPGRYRMHDLVRLYAAERARLDVSDAERAEALTRLVESCVRAACAADRLLSPNRPPMPGATGDCGGDRDGPDAELTGPESALAWFEEEQSALFAALGLAERLGLDSAVWRLAWAMDTYLIRRCLHEPRRAAWESALAAARRSGTAGNRALAHWYLGYAHAQAGRTAEGIGRLERALTLFERTGDLTGRAHTSHTLGYAWVLHGDPAAALGHAERALRLQRQLGDRIWEGAALAAVGWCQARLGRYAKARSYCVQALELFQRHRDPVGEAAALDSLGYIALRAGRHPRALDYYHRSLALREKLGDVYQGADTLARIGDVHQAMDDPAAAGAPWRRALELYEAQHRTAQADAVRERIRAAVPSAAAGPSDRAVPADR